MQKNIIINKLGKKDDLSHKFYFCTIKLFESEVVWFGIKQKYFNIKTSLGDFNEHDQSQI